MESTILYEKILSENADKGTQLRLVLNEFNGVEYLHLRKYYLSFEDGYQPTKEGASMPATIASIFALLDGLIEICAHEESIESITRHFEQKIIDLKNPLD